jgi:hypothetical protein
LSTLDWWKILEDFPELIIIFSFKFNIIMGLLHGTSAICISFVLFSLQTFLHTRMYETEKNRDLKKPFILSCWRGRRLSRTRLNILFQNSITKCMQREICFLYFFIRCCRRFLEKKLFCATVFKTDQKLCFKRQII